MALLAGKENNESYMFKEILKQDDSSDFVQAMLKKVDDHEKQGLWAVILRWQKPPEEKQF